MGKLTNTQRAAIYQAWKDGISMSELAKQYSVSTSAISQMIGRMNRTGIPAAEGKTEPKVAQINKEFDDAVNDMIAESESSDTEKKSAIAEEKSANAEPDKLPHYIWVALDDQVSAINWEIEQREQRIAELKEELLNLKNQRDAIEKWMEDHT